LLQKLGNVNDNKIKEATEDSFVVKKKEQMGKLNTCTTLITIYIQILKLFCFINQFIVVTSFQVIFHALIWQTVNTPIIKSIFNNYDDFVQVFHLKTTWSQNCQYPNKTKHPLYFNL
jgi:hypothetical protein